MSLADGSIRAAGTRGDERVERFQRKGRWYAWTFRDSREIYVAEDARVIRTSTLPDGESMWTLDLSAQGTLAVVTQRDDRYALYVMYAARTEHWPLAGEVDVRFAS